VLGLCAAAHLISASARPLAQMSLIKMEGPNFCARSVVLKRNFHCCASEVPINFYSEKHAINFFKLLKRAKECHCPSLNLIFAQKCNIFFSELNFVWFVAKLCDVLTRLEIRCAHVAKNHPSLSNLLRLFYIETHSMPHSTHLSNLLDL
jgi:hypothetical protein